MHISVEYCVRNDIKATTKLWQLEIIEMSCARKPHSALNSGLISPSLWILTYVKFIASESYVLFTTTVVVLEVAL